MTVMKELKHEKQTSMLAAECSSQLRSEFEKWAKNNGFASVSEAIRDYARKVTGFVGSCQG